MMYKIEPISIELVSLEPIKKQIERINMETQIIKEKTLSLKMDSLVGLNRELLEALKVMLSFSDSRSRTMSRSLEESSFADRVSDLILNTEEKIKSIKP